MPMSTVLCVTWFLRDCEEICPVTILGLRSTNCFARPDWCGMAFDWDSRTGVMSRTVLP